MKRVFFINLFFLFFVSLFCPVRGAARRLLRPEPLYQKIAAVTAQVLPGIHLEKRPVDDELSERAFKLFLEALDYNRCIFLQKDIDALKAYSNKLDDLLKAGNLSFGFKTYELYLRRFRQRVFFVEKQIEKGFDLTLDEDYKWERKESPWPADEAELNEIWRKRLKNEYISELLVREERELKKEKEKKQKEEKLKKENNTKKENNKKEVKIDNEQRPANDNSENAGLSKPDKVSALALLEKSDSQEEKGLDNIIDQEQTDQEKIDQETVDQEKSLKQKEADARKAAKELLEEQFDLSPEESILKRYRHQRTVLEDNDSEWVLQVFMSSFVSALDPHSSYMSPSEEKDFDISMKLSLFGIGAMLSPEEGTAKVVRLIPGGPALKDGRLKPGDRIIGVGQGDEPIVNTLHWPLSKTVKLIRGPKGSKVVLLVRKASEVSGPPEKIDIIRDEVKLEEQAAKGTTREVTLNVSSEASDPGLGVTSEVKKTLAIINLPAFYLDFSKNKSEEDKKSSTRDVHDIIKNFKKSGLHGIIVDLRSNGGGSLQEAVSMTGLFIESGPVVQVKQNTSFLSSGIQVLRDEDNSVAWDGPLVILISRASASASEIFAGAIKDYNRGIIIGDTSTHGKGTVQTIYPVNRFIRAADSEMMGSLKVTMAMFYRINGESTQRKGVKPHINIPSVFETMDLGEDKQPYALPFDVIPPADYYKINAVDENLISRLSALSLKRRQENIQFKSRNELLEKIKKRNKEKIITLNIEKRRTQREIERKLVEEQEKLSQEAMGQNDSLHGEGDSDSDETVKKDDKKSKDLVLEEAILILGDMIKYNRGSIK